MEIKVNKEKCICCGMCVSMCPDIFIIDDNSKVCTNRNNNININYNIIKDIELQCPVNAIKIDWERF